MKQDLLLNPTGRRRQVPVPASPASRRAGLRVLGLMSGTSLDGLDGAMCDCQPDHVSLVRSWSVRFPAALKRRLRATAAGETSSWDTAQLHHDLGRYYARTVAVWLEGQRVDAVGLHGQTVFHRPSPGPSATLQIGEASYLAAAVGVPVVADFRVADLAVGGHGAPLAPLFHEVAFAQRGHCVAVQNLGGIGNVTLLDWTGGTVRPRLLAFDTGPANLLLDLAMQQHSPKHLGYDRNGALARGGQVDEAALSRWLKFSYFRKAPPKSTGREMFGESFLRKIVAEKPSRSSADLLASLTEFTARSVVESYRRHLPRQPERIVLAGGGAANGFLVERLRRVWGDDASVITSETLGWPSTMIEAAAFALLAAYRLWNLPANRPEATGAGRRVRLGKIVE